MFLNSFWKDEQGQDLVEYALLMFFIVLAASALFIATSTHTATPTPAGGK